MHRTNWATRVLGSLVGTAAAAVGIASPGAADPDPGIRSLAEQATTAARTAAEGAMAMVQDGHRESPKQFSGDRIRDNGSVAKQLLGHYYGKSGRSVVIDWSFFSRDTAFMEFARSLPVGQKESAYSSRAGENGMDMLAGLNNFAVTRTSANCYAVRDYYDFDLESPFASLKKDALNGAAKEFTVRSSGCDL